MRCTLYKPLSRRMESWNEGKRQIKTILKQCCCNKCGAHKHTKSLLSQSKAQEIWWRKTERKGKRKKKTTKEKNATQYIVVNQPKKAKTNCNVIELSCLFQMGHFSCAFVSVWHDYMVFTVVTAAAAAATAGAGFADAITIIIVAVAVSFTAELDTCSVLCKCVPLFAVTFFLLFFFIFVFFCSGFSTKFIFATL